MSINQLYLTWLRQILQLMPGERITRIRNLTWLLVGIYWSRSVLLARIASQLPWDIRRLSWCKRHSRLVANPALQVRPLYDPLARAWLAHAAHITGEIRLVIDATHIGCGYQLVLVGLAHRRRCLPLAWGWTRGPKGHSPACLQRQVLAHVRHLLPAGGRVELVGDSRAIITPVWDDRKDLLNAHPSAQSGME